MNINLTALKNTGLTTSNRTFKHGNPPAPYKALDPNIISVSSNSVHYRLVREETGPKGNHVTPYSHFYLD